MTKPSSSLVQAILGSGSIVGVMDAVAGIVYGVLVWLAMNFVVVPLSQVASGPIRVTRGHGHHDPDPHVRYRGTDRILGGALLLQVSVGP